EDLAAQSKAGIATLCAPIAEAAEAFNPNAVKVVLDKDGYALYFSRAPIPWDRAGFASPAPPAGDGANLTAAMPYYRHIGLYAYTVAFLRRYVAWPASALEGVEAWSNCASSGRAKRCTWCRWRKCPKPVWTRRKTWHGWSRRCAARPKIRRRPRGARPKSLIR
ncbi:cytidylyltransferase domain-containing protein, partial [Methylogaea oryzae]|uniref:cytidylyltransferase domain-containing protein n=1 Tax=Methylogaea oryzae TaxID=1295382 RepID=UPI000B0E756F